MRARSISEASPIGTARAVRNLSRNSLTLGIIFGTAVTLLIGAGAVNNIQFESRALTRVFEEAAGRTVAGIAAGLSESVRNPSPNWTEPLDDYVAATPDIIAISVTGNGQDRFVSTGGGESFPPAPVLTIAHDIVFQGSKIGSVEVNFDRLHLAADIARVRVGTLRRAPLIWTGVMILVVLLLVYRQRHRRSADDNRQLRDEVRRRTAAEKQESAARARLEDIASLTSDFYWESDAEGIVRYVSQRFSAITGAVDDLVVGKAIGQGSWTPTAESGERIAEIFSKRLTVRNEPFRYTDKKGDLRVISGSAAPRFDEQGDYVGHRGTSREVTAEVEASRRLAASEQRFRNIAAMTADLFWETDPDGKLTFFLTKGDSRLSRAPDEVIGMHFLELVKEFAPDSLAEHERAINARQPFSGLRQDGHLPDGSPLHLVANGQPVFDAAGTYLGFQGATRDVTDLVLAEKRAATSTRQMESYLYNAPAAILIKDRELRFTHINRTYSAWSGRTLEMVLGKPITEIHGNSAKSRAYQEIDRHVLETGRAQIDEDTFTFDDGIERRVSTNRFPIFDDGGTVVGVGTFITDITEQYKAQEAAAGLSRQLEEFLNNSPSAIAIKDRDGRFTQVNGTWSALIGLPAADVIGKTNAEIRPDGLARNWIETQDRQSMATAAPVSGEHSVIAADGRSRRVSSVRYPLFDGRGEITHLASITTDITAQYEAQRQAAAATQQLVGFVENSPATIVFKDLDNRYVRVNKAFCDWTGMAEDELVGKTTAEIYGSDNARLLENMNRRAAETRDVVEGEHWISFPNGTARYVSMTRFPLFDESGAVYQVAAINVDITAEREARFQIDGILENSPSAIFVKDTKGQFLFANPTFTEWFGVPPSGVAGNTSHDLCPPEFADACADQDRKVLADSEPHEILLEVSFTDGERHWITMTKFPISAPDGTTIGIGTVNTDVTQVQRAEERLRQAHRLEAIGQLTGGVAHDFNNLLTVAQGNLELLEMTLSDSGQRKWLTAAIRAIQRGGSLTQQLLSFARKQTLAPSSISVAETVEHIAAMSAGSFAKTLHSISR